MRRDNGGGANDARILVECKRGGGRRSRRGQGGGHGDSSLACRAQARGRIRRAQRFTSGVGGRMRAGEPKGYDDPPPPLGHYPPLPPHPGGFRGIGPRGDGGGGRPPQRRRGPRPGPPAPATSPPPSARPQGPVWEKGGMQRGGHPGCQRARGFRPPPPPPPPTNHRGGGPRTPLPVLHKLVRREHVVPDLLPEVRLH